MPMTLSCVHSTFSPLLLSITLLFFSATTADAQLLAFPTAEGYGRDAKGGRGGDVYHVTNLNDDGAGSLRYGISNASGHRPIVFDVGGTILVNSQIGITKNFITIAGQTAPGDGIQVAGKGVAIGDNFHDIIVRFIRSREGLYLPSLSAKHSFNINIGCENIIFDHCSAEFGRDETFSMEGNNTTAQWCIVAWGLETHSCGSLLRGKSVTVHHNLWAHNHTRNPKSTGDNLDWVNNVVFDWDIPFIAGDFQSSDGEWDLPHRANIVGTYFISTSSTTKAVENANLIDGNPTYSLYLSNTLLDGNANGKLDGTDQGYNIVSGTVEKLTSRVATPQVKTDDPLTAYTRVLDRAGCVLPGRIIRDSIDNKLIDNVKKQAKQRLTNNTELGFGNHGYGTLRSGTPPKDTDLDGMPDAWEAAHNLNINNANDRNATTLSTDGYTNLEMYLNELAGDISPDVSLNRVREPAGYGAPATTGYALNLTGSVIELTAPVVATITVEVLDLSGRRIVTLFQGTVAAGKTVVPAMGNASKPPAGVGLIRLHSSNGSILVRKVVSNAGLVKGKRIGDFKVFYILDYQERKDK
jgi:hypothetical protein